MRKSLFHRVVIFYLGFAILHFGLYRMLGVSFTLNTDSIQFLYPILSVLKRHMAEGRLPFWFSEAYTGFPLFFVGSYDLKSFLLLPWFSALDVIYLHASFYMFFSGATSYLCFKKLFQFSNSASFTASLFWTFSGAMIASYYDQIINIVYIWVPIFLVCLFYFKESRVRSFIILVVGACDEIITGRFDGLEIAALMILIFGVLELFNSQAKSAATTLVGWRAKLRWSAQRAAIGIAAVGVAALILFPFCREQWSVVHDSFRSGLTIAPHLFPLSIVNFFTLIPNSKEFFNFENGMGNLGYIGPFFAALILIGCVKGPRRKQSLLSFLVAIFVSLFTYDIAVHGTTLFDIYRLLPGHHAMRYALRFVPVYLMLLCVPLMSGWDALFTKSDARTSSRVPLSIVLFFAIFSAGFLLSLSSSHAPEFLTWKNSAFQAGALAASLISLIFAIGTLLFEIDKRWLLSAVTVTWIFTGYLVSYFDIEISPLHYFETVQNNPKLLEFADAIKSRDPDFFKYRIAHLTRDVQAHSQFLIAQGFHSLSGYHPLAPGDFANFVTTDLKASFFNALYAQDVDPFAYGLANVKYFVSAKGDPRTLAGVNNGLLSPVFSRPDNEFEVYENLRVLPRVYIASEAHVSNTDSALQSVAAVLSHKPDWFKSGVFLSDCPSCSELAQPVATTLPKGTSSAIASATISLYESDKVIIQAVTNQPAYLVLLDRFDQTRWEAKVDGELTHIARANGLFRAVRLSKGQHEVVFSYHSPSWAWWISIAGIALFLLTTVLLRRRSSAPRQFTV
jgi:hypothetical protein